ncbi:terminase small subunit [Alistipes finegoldii]|jgi:hypothetical protein|uniref:terminase small subunit n=1 Tax=Alistipes finegoldii TaxID=214856 RepID=UPI00280594D8|nr:terminase small subunit [uncultured Alistipes sp.]
MAANQDQQHVGRPRKFSSPEEMQAAIDAYFAACEKKDEPLTIEGLCEALEVDRRTILNYGKLEAYSAFFPTVKKSADARPTGFGRSHAQRRMRGRRRDLPAEEQSWVRGRADYEVSPYGVKSF